MLGISYIFGQSGPGLAWVYREFRNDNIDNLGL